MATNSVPVTFSALVGAAMRLAAGLDEVAADLALVRARIGGGGFCVWTVIGETGNSDGPYTRELPSLSAALDAICNVDFPLVRVSADGLREEGSRFSRTIKAGCEHVYQIVGHEPYKVTGHTATGGHHVAPGVILSWSHGLHARLWTKGATFHWPVHPGCGLDSSTDGEGLIGGHGGVCNSDLDGAPSWVPSEWIAHVRSRIARGHVGYESPNVGPKMFS